VFPKSTQFDELFVCLRQFQSSPKCMALAASWYLPPERQYMVKEV